MDFATGGRMTKMDYAICIAAALGYMMIHQQDAVGLAMFDETLREFLPPRSKRTQLTNILTLLSRQRPQGKTMLAAAIHDIAGRVKKRGLMILISDLLSDQAQVLEALRHVRFRGHDIIVFQVLDHSEVSFDFDAGAVRFEDPETGDTVQADPLAIRAAYQRELRRFIDEYRTTCQSIRADFVTVDNSMTFDNALIEFLAQRQQRF
jgi:uncharacterized protein (DUF58 family)